MSHDRGCFQCGRDVYEYDDCPRDDCTKRTKVWSFQEDVTDDTTKTRVVIFQGLGRATVTHHVKRNMYDIFFYDGNMSKYFANKYPEHCFIRKTPKMPKDYRFIDLPNALLLKMLDEGLGSYNSLKNEYEKLKKMFEDED